RSTSYPNLDTRRVVACAPPTSYFSVLLQLLPVLLGHLRQNGVAALLGSMKEAQQDRRPLGGDLDHGGVTAVAVRTVLVLHVDVHAHDQSLFSRSLSAGEGEKVTVRRGGIFTGSPVRGLRRAVAARCLTSRRPNPRIEIDSPADKDMDSR